MVFTDDLVFIHIPKTGGMSCSRYLLRVLNGRIYNCHANADEECCRLGRPDLVPVMDVNRHCTLAAAMGHIQRVSGDQSDRQRTILAVIRHPASLEYSFYRHLQKPHIAERRRKKSPQLVELAMGDFKHFVAGAGYHREGLRQEDYFLVDGKTPANLQLLRYEELAEAFPAADAAIMGKQPELPFPHLNPSGANSRELDTLLDEETLELVYQKHAYLFDEGYYSLRQGY